MDNPNIFTVVEARLSEALEALAKLAKKAERYGTPPITWTLGEVWEEKRRDAAGRIVKVQFRDITLSELEAPRVGDFQFIARLEITDAGTIIDSIPGEELPRRFREATNCCDHCQHDRPRKHLFVVRDPAGELVQVGRSCLRDFMGTDTPASVAARFRWERELREFGDQWRSTGKVEDSAEELLAVTSAAIRLWGWVPKSAPEEVGTPTAFRIGVWFYCPPQDSNGQAERAELKAAICEGDWDTARSAMEWVADSSESGDSEYLHNLRTVLAPGIVTPKRRGLACSAVGSYQRHMGTLAERQRTAEAVVNSQHIGEVGQRLKDLRLTVKYARGFQTPYGTTILYKFQDPLGNMLSWFSSGGAGLDVNTEVSLDATVKGHVEFQGVAETQLTRAKVRADQQA